MVVHGDPPLVVAVGQERKQHAHMGGPPGIRPTTT
jgi:hypothetical protein